MQKSQLANLITCHGYAPIRMGINSQQHHNQLCVAGKCVWGTDGWKTQAPQELFAG